MPLYTYEIINDDGSIGETFEVMRKMSDPPLERHPETGQKVRRVFQPIHIAAADCCLNDRGYILPGLGDAGDRLYGTECGDSGLELDEAAEQQGGLT